MSNHSPITPPPELVQEWWASTIPNQSTNVKTQLCIQAAQWGADQELEACCKWLPKLPPWSGNDLRKHRRPKPPSRKEQALEAIGRLCASVIHDDLKNDAATIRRAIEQLPD